MRISVIGAGYVGLVTGTCFADRGHDVTIVEINAERARAVNNGHSPIYEVGLDDLLKKNLGKTLHVSTRFDAVSASELVFICVGTPSAPDGSTDLSYIESASSSIGIALRAHPAYCCVVVKSTVPPGTTENVVCPRVLAAAEKTEGSIGFAMNPEFLREGRAVEDFMNPDRIVIGSNDEISGNWVAKVYEKNSGPILHTSLSAAEMIKYTSNAFLATKISFSNEIGNICKQLGIDVYEVMNGVGRDHRIGPMFLNAGAGFGGSCFPKDLASLINLAKKTGEDPLILQSVLAVNERQPLRMVTLLEQELGTISGKKITVLGLAFKENTDDIRDSRSIPVIGELLKKGARVSCYDPMAVPNMKQVFPTIEYCNSAADALTDADGCLLMTEWPEFARLDKEFDLMAHRIIIEGRRVLSCKDAVGICW